VNILVTRGSCNDKLSEEMTGARFTDLASSTRVPELDYFVECGEKLSAVRRPHNASNIMIVSVDFKKKVGIICTHGQRAISRRISRRQANCQWWV
jgi:hypothetical protein